MALDRSGPRAFPRQRRPALNLRLELIYLYGIVPEDTPDPPPDLEGIDEERGELVRLAEVAAIVSRVAEDDYSDEALNARLDDLAWVGERGVAHERVLDWFASRGAVIPLSLFSLHRDEDRLRQRIGVEEASFARILERLQGRKEWGIKLWRHGEAAARRLDESSPSLRAIAARIEEAPTGRRFLLEKKQASMRTEEIRAISKRLAHEVYADLAEHAVAAESMPLPPAAPAAERTLLLHAAFLVDDGRFDAFQDAVNRQAARAAPVGFEIEFTGPWPPYHFTTPDDD